MQKQKRQQELDLKLMLVQRIEKKEENRKKKRIEKEIIYPTRLSAR